MRCMLLAVLFLCSLPQLIFSHDNEHGGLSVSHPWIVEPPPRAPSAAGYLVITNEGDEDDTLVGVTAEFAGRAEIHTMNMTADGVMQMRPVEDGLLIESGQPAVLEPGGLHIMFMDLAGPLQGGDEQTVVLEFEKAGPVSVDFFVQKRDSGMDMSMEDEK